MAGANPRRDFASPSSTLPEAISSVRVLVFEFGQIAAEGSVDIGAAG